MGLARRRHNQAAVTEAAEREQQAASGTVLPVDAGRRPAAAKAHQHPALSILLTLALACGFWLTVQALARYAAHLAPHHPGPQGAA